MRNRGGTRGARRSASSASLPVWVCQHHFCRSDLGATACARLTRSLVGEGSADPRPRARRSRRRPSVHDRAPASLRRQRRLQRIRPMCAKLARSQTRWTSFVVRGDVYEIKLPRGRGRVQHGRRFAVIASKPTISLALSTTVVCRTTTSTPPASFHPEMTIRHDQKRIICERWSVQSLRVPSGIRSRT
jgi:PemK-like, MazF-like toxin of type II toxin-antitoxin system